jgi:hypothetical protein
MTEQLVLFHERPANGRGVRDQLVEVIRARVAEPGMSAAEIEAVVADALEQLRPPRRRPASCACERPLVLSRAAECVWCGRAL